MKRTSEYSAAVIAVWNIAMADSMSALGFEIGSVNVMDPLPT